MKRFACFAVSAALLLSVLLTGCGHRPIPADAQPQPTLQAPTSVEAAPSPRLTPEEAGTIALTHAQLSPEAVRDFEIEPDRAFGRVIYEISFDAAGREYEYAIEADTGEILHSKTERD